MSVTPLPSDEDFEARLGTKEMVDRFRDGKRQISRQVATEFEAKADSMADQKRAALETEREHRSLLNLCVAPFSGLDPGAPPGGYSFVRGSPLEELGVSNFDFLLATNPIGGAGLRLIAGEGKSSIGDVGAVLAEIERKKTAFVANLRHVRERYLGQSADGATTVEYVLAVYSGDAPRVLKAAVDAGRDLIVWHASTTGPEFVRAAVPPGDPAPEMKHVHRDAGTRRAMEGLRSVRLFFNVWPKSHPVTELEALLVCARPGTRGLTVRMQELKEVLDKDLFYLTPEERAAKAQRILDMGVRIGFLEVVVEGDEYHLVARGSRRPQLEQALQDKWIENQIQFDATKEIASRVDVLKDELLKQSAKSRRLDEFV